MEPVAATRDEFYKLIQDTQLQLNRFYPLVGRIEESDLINCRGDTLAKNDAPAHVLANYDLIFEDTFNGQLREENWNTRFLWGPDRIINDEDQYYVDVLGGSGWQGNDPFTFSAEGNLQINAEPIDPGGPQTAAFNQVTGQTDAQPLSSGIITTRDTCNFRYGYCEVCLKDPCCPSGMWTAAWLLNSLYYSNAFTKNEAERGDGSLGNDKWNPEIDFKESVDNYGCDGTVKNAYHYFTGDGNAPSYHLWSLDGGNFRQVDVGQGGLVSQFNTYPTCDGSFIFNLPDTPITGCSEFHTVAVDWAPEYIHYYVNGILVNCVNQPNIVTDQTMYLLINFAAGGGFPFGTGPGGAAAETVDLNDYPATLEVDYARIYLHPEGRASNVQGNVLVNK